MPHRIPIVWTVVLGAVGLPLVAWLLILRRELRAEANRGPRWKRTLLTAALALLAAVGGFLGGRYWPSEQERALVYPNNYRNLRADDTPQWKQIAATWRQAEEIASGRLGPCPFTRDEQHKLLSDLEQSACHATELEWAGQLSPGEAGLLRGGLLHLAEAVARFRPVEDKMATCYSPTPPYTESERSLDYLARQVGLLEMLVSADRINRDVAARVVPTIEAELAVIEQEKYLDFLDKQRQLVPTNGLEIHARQQADRYPQRDADEIVNRIRGQLHRLTLRLSPPASQPVVTQPANAETPAEVLAREGRLAASQWQQCRAIMGLFVTKVGSGPGGIKTIRNSDVNLLLDLIDELKADQLLSPAEHEALRTEIDLWSNLATNLEPMEWLLSSPRHHEKRIAALKVLLEQQAIPASVCAAIIASAGTELELPAMKNTTGDMTAQVTATKDLLEQCLAKVASGDDELQRLLDWKRILVASRMASAASFGVSQVGRSLLLTWIDGADAAADRLVAAGLLSPAEAAVIKLANMNDREDARTWEPGDDDDSTIMCYISIPQNPVEQSMKYLASRLPLLEKAAAGGKLDPQVVARVVPEIRAKLIAMVNGREVLKLPKPDQPKAKEMYLAAARAVIRIEQNLGQTPALFPLWQEPGEVAPTVKLEETVERIRHYCRQIDDALGAGNRRAATQYAMLMEKDVRDVEAARAVPGQSEVFKSEIGRARGLLNELLPRPNPTTRKE